MFTSFLIFLLISSSWYFIDLLRMEARFISLSFVGSSYVCVLLTFMHHILLYLIIFDPSRDIEKSPGPKPNSYQSFCICRWNINSISAHNFLKLSLDVIYLSETYLDSFILHDDDNLQIQVIIYYPISELARPS